MKGSEHGHAEKTLAKARRHQQSQHKKSTNEISKMLMKTESNEVEHKDGKWKIIIYRVIGRHADVRHQEI